MYGRDVRATRRLAKLMPELSLRLGRSHLLVPPVDEFHRSIVVEDRRKLGLGVTARVCIGAFYLPYQMSEGRTICCVTVGRGEVNTFAEQVYGDLVKELRGEPIRRLHEVATPFGLVDYLRSGGITDEPLGMFEYGMALAHAGARNEAGRRLLKFMGMEKPSPHPLMDALMLRAETMVDALREKNSRRDELFEKWILEGKRNWGLAPEEGDDEETFPEDEELDVYDWPEQEEPGW